MFDIGWSEMAVIVLVALIVIGPKELPNAMRTAAKWARKARGLAREFQSGIDDMIREAELQEARDAIESTQSLDLDKALEDTVDPTGSVRAEAEDLQRVAHQEADAEATAEAAAEPAASPSPEPATTAGEIDGGATVIEHPVSIAPAHSIVPPAPEPVPEAVPETEADRPEAAPSDDAPQKSA